MKLLKGSDWKTKYSSYAIELRSEVVFLKCLQMELFHTDSVDKYTVQIYQWKYF